jgi:hypothetical protein
MLVPHEVPCGLLVLELVQVDAPVLQEVTPTLQGFEFVVQLAPALQATQVPLELHTRFVPQLVPALTLVLELVHVEAPVLHEVTPTLHGLEFVLHDVPPVHATQLPAALQTRLLPQLVPGASLLEPSTQVAVPVAHDCTPTRHAVGFVVHAPPALQLPQLPALHTWPEPHAVPFARLVVPSSQTGAPLAQEIRPALHGLGLVLHEPPAVQATHVPAPSHTRLLPQLVPAACSVVPLVHTAAPLAQEITPSTQRFELVLQSVPAAQEPQAPALQT